MKDWVAKVNKNKIRFPHLIFFYIQVNSRWIKTFKTKNKSSFLAVAPICKKLGSCYSHPYNKKKLDKCKLATFLGLIR